MMKCNTLHDLTAGPCNRIIIYSKKIDAMVQFYSDHFDYQVFTKPDDRIVELRRNDGGMILMLHPAGKGQKEGQSLIKLVFDVSNVEAFRQKLIDGGLDIGPIHQADQYQFANFKDPSGNSVSISSRAYAPH
ncbi:VOC family protein [Thalassospira lucentensis]|uniref:VOC family protein n=1 Tax=Thalassospira lucentensis TaxID=168935 RepID=UPI003D2F434E